MNLVKAGLVVLLLVYLIVIYRGDSAKDLPMDQVTAEDGAGSGSDAAAEEKRN